MAHDEPQRDERVIPVQAEEIKVDRRTVETGRVRVRKEVHERDVVVEEPVVNEEIDVRRVPVDRVVDAPQEVRQEGETTIIPVYEEVLVVEKRLKLKEEIHVTRRRVEERQPQTVRLRREEVVVEHEDVPPEPQPGDES